MSLPSERFALLAFAAIVASMAVAVARDHVARRAAEPPRVEEWPVRRVHDIEPKPQARMLCGVTVGELMLQHHGIDRVGEGGRYAISASSRGAALGQWLCDLIDAGAITTGQPPCSHPVYADGGPTEHTEEAFHDGTWLDGMRQAFELLGIRGEYVPSVWVPGTERYDRAGVAPNFPRVLDHLHAGRLVGIHVDRDGVNGDGHFLLLHGYDDAARAAYVIDTAPLAGADARSLVSYDALRDARSALRGDGEWFWTGRYLAVW